MPFSGDLDVVELAQVFQMLASGQKEGRLIVEKAGERREIWFSPDGVSPRMDQEELRDRVLHLLRRLDQIPEEVFQKAVAQAKEYDSHPLNTLITEGVIQPAEINDRYRLLMAEQIYPLFEWKGARFEFVEEKLSDPNKTGARPQFLLRADHVVMEAARRMDERASIRLKIPHERSVFVPTLPSEDTQIQPLADAEKRCIRFVDGYRCVAQIADETGLSHFEAEKALFALCGRGWVRVILQDELSHAATEAFEGNRFFEAANLYEQAAEAWIDLPDSLGAAGRAREAREDYYLAVKHYFDYAEALAARGKKEEALEALDHSIELLPTDLRSRSRRLHLILREKAGVPEGFDLFAETRELADLYSEMGNFEASLQTLQQLIEKYPEHREIREFLATVYQRGGEMTKAYSVYSDLGEECRISGEVNEAIQWWQRALQLDPSKKELRQKIQDLQMWLDRRKKRKRGVIIVSSVGVCCAIFAGLIFIRESRAREAFSKLGAEDLVLKGNYSAAESMYKEFLDEYPFSFMAREAQRGLERVEKLKSEGEQKTQVTKMTDDIRRAKQLANAEKSWKYANEIAEQGNLQEALQWMRRALEEAPADWERRGRAQKEVEDVQDYFSRAEEQLQLAGLQKEQGQFPEARKTLRNLLDRFPNAPSAALVEIPFRVETQPPGAHLSWEGNRLSGKTPQLVQLKANSKGTLLIEREGFAPQSVPLHGEGNEDVKLALLRVPDQVISLDGVAVTDPTISANRLYCGISGGKLLACDLESGQSVWSFAIDGFGELTSSPTVAGEWIFFGASDQRFYALNRSGKKVWNVSLSKTVRTLPLFWKSDLFVVGESGELVSLQMETGEENWRISLNAAVFSPMILMNDRLVVGDWKGRIRLIDPKDGEELNTLYAGTGVAWLLTVPDEKFLLLGEDGRLALWSLSAGRELWVRPGTGLGDLRPVVRGEKIWFLEGKQLIALDINSGAVIDRIDIPALWAKGLRFGAGAIYGRDAEGYWVSVEPENRVIRWRAKLPSVEVGFQVDPRSVWILGKDKKIYLFDEAKAQFSSLNGR